MAEQSTQAIDVAAPPDAVLAVVADFERYPEWADGVRSCEVLARDDAGRAERVRFVIDAGVIKDDYELGYEWADDGLGVGWTLLRGQLQRAQHGSYRLEPLADSRTRVTYSLAVDLAVPMLGLLKRKAERAIMDTALKRLKQRAEQLARDR